MLRLMQSIALSNMAVDNSVAEVLEDFRKEDKCEQDTSKTASSASNDLVKKLCNKLSHKKWRRLWKKEKRRRLRQQMAKKFELLEEEEKIKSGLTNSDALEAKRKHDEWQEFLEEKRRQKLHDEWLSKEKLAQEDFDRKKKDDEKRKQERIEQEKRIKEEWENEQKREKEMKENKEQNTKNREISIGQSGVWFSETNQSECSKATTDKLTKVLEKSGIIKSSTDEGEWHNPIVTGTPAESKLYGTEQDPNNCSFFLKTGACRFGDRCSRQHPRPENSTTLLIPNMFQDVRLTEAMLDEKDQDVGLEFDEEELFHNFKDFYKDVIDEFKSVGELCQFKVCNNFEPHLRGNVYVQYKTEDGATQAFAKFNGRWYAGKQLSVQFSPVNKWRSAICGTFVRNRCPRGKNCNFLHVFKNPNSEFFEADRDLEPAKDRQPSTRRSEREWRSSTRELERRWERADSQYSERSGHRRERRSKRRSRSRGRYRSRSRERYRSRSNSRERSVSKAKHRRHRPRSRSRERRSEKREKSTRSNRSPSALIEHKKHKHKRRRDFSESDSDEEILTKSKSKYEIRKSKHFTRKSFKVDSDKNDDNFEPEYDSD